MSGRNLLDPDSRMVFAAGLFALVGGIVFAVAWYWPVLDWFMGVNDATSATELTREAKERALREIQANATTSSVDRNAALKELAPAVDNMTLEQKEAALQALSSE